MTTFVTIPDADVDQDSPVTVALMTALRDNPLAIADGGGGPVLGLTMLAATTIASDATVDFTAEFNSTRYESYVFAFSNIVGASASIFLMRTSTDAGSSYDAGASDYAYNYIKNGTSTSNATATSMQLINPVPTTSDRGFSGVVELSTPDITNRTLVFGNFVSDTGGIPDVYTVSGVRNSAADVDGVRFLNATGNLSTGVITMYGRGRV